jgi:uncharacterized protein (TIGR03086 family)
VRDLVNHVTSENLWTAPLMEGATIEEVGDRFEGDVLGEDPIASALAAAGSAITAVAAQLPQGGTVHLSFGDTPAEEYAMQLAADNLVHGWDLAVAIGGDHRMDPHLVHAVAHWFDDREELYRGGGAISARRPLSGDAQHDLLARFGRDAAWGPNHGTLARFVAAFCAGDVEAALALVTDDVVVEASGPAPDGRRHEGRDAVRSAWTELLGAPGTTCTEEESLVSGDRAVVRWRYDSPSGHTRAVDLLRLRDGQVCEQLAYAKG